MNSQSISTFLIICFASSLSALAQDPGKVLQNFASETSETLHHHQRGVGPQEQAQNTTNNFLYDLQTLEERHMDINDQTFSKLVQSLHRNVPALVGNTRAESLPVVRELVGHYQGIANGHSATSTNKPKDVEINRAKVRLDQLLLLQTKLEK